MFPLQNKKPKSSRTSKDDDIRQGECSFKLYKRMEKGKVRVKIEKKETGGSDEKEGEVTADVVQPAASANANSPNGRLASETPPASSCSKTPAASSCSETPAAARQQQAEVSARIPVADNASTPDVRLERRYAEVLREYFFVCRFVNSNLPLVFVHCAADLWRNLPQE